MFDISDPFASLNQTFEVPEKAEENHYSQKAPVRQEDLDGIYTAIAKLNKRVADLEKRLEIRSPMESYAKHEDYEREIARSTHRSHCTCQYCQPLRNREQEYEEGTSRGDDD